MPEHNAGPGGWSAVHADPGTAAQGAPVEVLEAQEPQRVQYNGQPAMPMGWQTRVEPVVETQAQEAVGETGAVAAAAAPALPELLANEPPQEPTPLRSGPVTPPLRIIAAIIGVALGAVPFAMATSKAAPAPAPQPHVAHFQVSDRDVPIFWSPHP